MNRESVDATNHADIGVASQRLRAAIDAKKAGQVPVRRAVLIKMKELIGEARSEGFSHARIAKTLSDNGVRVTKHDVAQFCIHELGEAPAKRRRRRKKKIPPDGQAPMQTVPARAARGLSGVVVSKEVTPVPACSKTGSFQSLASPGARPGFRVARDEDL